MKKILLAAAFIAIAILVYSFLPKKGESPTSSEAGAVKWLTMEQAIKANKTNKKKFFIDVYTDWCGWCKRMDATTFSDPAVAAYINSNFHPVKFNAEQKEDFDFNGQTFKWQAGGRNGVHMFAYALLDGNLGYPSYVYLTPEFERILVSPGFKEVPGMNKELKYVSENHYVNRSWEDFQAGK
jgi:uncharacterized protein YyaL (SSP411 family)